ncbi:MAG: hypothetical protein AAGC72_17235, partial [Planctomycetota bacterium]
LAASLQLTWRILGGTVDTEAGATPKAEVLLHRPAAVVPMMAVKSSDFECLFIKNVSCKGLKQKRIRLSTHVAVQLVLSCGCP